MSPGAYQPVTLANRQAPSLGRNPFLKYMVDKQVRKMGYPDVDLWPQYIHAHL